MWNYRAIIIVAAASIVLVPLDTGKSACDPGIPQEIQSACDKWGEAYDICPELLEAVCYAESRYTADAIGGDCKGLMQINEPVHVKRIEKLGITDIYDVDSNIHVGADILAELFRDYSTDAGTVLMLYHGEQNALTKGRTGDYSEYAQSVLDMSEQLERAHGK